MCWHRITQGDNYGITCMECGETLEGYGYWAESSNTCNHHFIPESPESENEICMYCETTRAKLECN